MAYLLRSTIDPKWQVSFDWPPDTPFLSRSDNRGEPKLMRREQVPTKATFTAGRAKLPDFALAQSWMVISHRLRSHIASLEPDRNQYFAFDVARKNGKPVLGADGEPHRDPYYLINTTTRFDYILLPESGIQLGPLDFGLVGFSQELLPSIVVNEEMVAGSHVWEGVKHLMGKIIVSDELGDWIIANKMKGVRIHRLREARASRGA